MPCPYELAFLSNFIIIQLVEELKSSNEHSIYKAETKSRGTNTNLNFNLFEWWTKWKWNEKCIYPSTFPILLYCNVIAIFLDNSALPLIVWQKFCVENRSLSPKAWMDEKKSFEFQQKIFYENISILCLKGQLHIHDLSYY